MIDTASIFREAYELTGFKLVTIPEAHLTNLMDNLGTYMRDYPEQFPRALPLLKIIAAKQT